MTVPTLEPNKDYLLGTSGFNITSSDSDGDTITKYEIKTSSAGHAFWKPNSYFTPNGSVVFAANALRHFYIKGYSRSLTQTIQIRAHDGTGWGAYTSVTVKTQTTNSSVSYTHLTLPTSR